jgi:hypothetical protein
LNSKFRNVSSFKGNVCHFFTNPGLSDGDDCPTSPTQTQLLEDMHSSSSPINHGGGGSSSHQQQQQQQQMHPNLLDSYSSQLLSGSGGGSKFKHLNQHLSQHSQQQQQQQHSHHQQHASSASASSAVHQDDADFSSLLLRPPRSVIPNAEASSRIYFDHLRANVNSDNSTDNDNNGESENKSRFNCFSDKKFAWGMNHSLVMLV